MKLPATIISSIAIVIAIIWFYYEPGFEPVITSLLGISGLLWSLSHSKTTNKSNTYSREFDALKARWYAEKAIKPASTDDARWLLGEALGFLSTLRVDDNSDEHHPKIDELTQKIKTIQNMQIFIDGGKSYAEFWNNGSEALEETAVITNKI